MNDKAPVTPPGSDDESGCPPQGKSLLGSVDEIALVLKTIRLRTLICVPGDAPVTMGFVADLKCEGALKEGSISETEFTAVVTWSTVFSDEKAPITISGKHELTFSIGKPVNEGTATYYAEVNSVVLVYPYIRQLVDDLSSKSLGRSLMIRPLDVPAFVKNWAKRKAKAETIEQGNPGTKPNGAQGNR